MAGRPPPEEPPESITLGAFTGMKNTVSEERLGPQDLVRAINVDIDDTGQVRVRRGYNREIANRFHSLKTIIERTYVVRAGMLGRIVPNFIFQPIVEVGDAPVAYTAVGDDVYFSGAATQGILGADNALQPWGHTDGQGRWLSPVLSPTDTLGEVGGKLLGDVPRARCLAAYKGRIYAAVGKTLWATELYLYHYVDRTKNFMQFEHEITMLMAMDDGLYVGTTGGLYFIKGVLGKFVLTQINGDAVVPGSEQEVPQELVHPNARNAPMPVGTAAVFMTSGGIMCGLDGGTCYNLTTGTMSFPQATSAASLFRQDQGANAYVAVLNSSGGPAANARIGDYVDAEIVRRQ